MDPSICGELIDLYGEAFDKKYCEYERRGLGVREVDAKDVWFAIL